MGGWLMGKGGKGELEAEKGKMEVYLRSFFVFSAPAHGSCRHSWAAGMEV